MGACVATLHAGPKEKNLKLDADYFYNHLAFAEAIPYYEKLAATNGSQDIYIKLGNSYRLINDPVNAANWYAKAVADKDCPDEVKLLYGMQLMSMGKYKDAQTALLAYQKKHPDEVRVNNLLQGCDNAMQQADAPISSYVQIMDLSTNGSDFGPFVKDGWLYFVSDSMMAGMKGKTDNWTGGHFYNMYKVKCTPDGRTEGNVERVGANLNATYHDGPVFFANEGNTMYFTRTSIKNRGFYNQPFPGRNDIVNLKVMTATGYDAAKDKFSEVKPFPFNDNDYSTAFPTLSPNGQLMIFASDMDGSKQGVDLYWTRKGGDGNWSKPESLGSPVNTEGDEMTPYLLDEHTLYFASNGHAGWGGYDVYVSHFDAQAKTWSTPQNLGKPFNSPYDDLGVAFEANGKMGYFSSNRPAVKKGDNLYRFEMARIFLKLVVKDEFNGQPVSGVTVALNTRDIATKRATNSDGMLIEPLAPRADYTIALSRLGYEPKSLVVTTKNAKDNDTIVTDVVMRPDANIQYSPVVIDKTTNQPVEECSILMSSSKTGITETLNYVYGANLSTKLEPDAEYHVYASKNNYYGSEKLINTEGIYTRLTIRDTLYLHKLEVGEVYKLDNIYYDFNKTTVREDAKPALNGLLGLLNQNPNMRIQLNSHTDCRGSDSYNYKLSDGRAKSVIMYLKERGIAINRLKYKGYGETKPVVNCKDCTQCTEEEHQENRRTEFQVLGM